MLLQPFIANEVVLFEPFSHGYFPHRSDKLFPGASERSVLTKSRLAVRTQHDSLSQELHSSEFASSADVVEQLSLERFDIGERRRVADASHEIDFE